MNITTNASNLNWMTNGNNLWAARLDDLGGNSVTFSEGYTPTIANKLIKVTNATKPTGTLTYESDANAVTATTALFGIGNVKDTEDVIGGTLTRRIGSVDLSTLSWTEGDGTWTTSLDGIKSNTSNVMCANGYEATVSGTDVTITSSSSPTGMMYYELDTAVESTETAQTMTMTTGDNTLAQTDGGRTTDYDLNYNGTNLSIALDDTRKYAFSDNGVKSMITGETEQDVTTGEDILVDINQLVNGDATKIAAITSWADLAAQYPEYASYVNYNAGTVVGLTPMIKATGKNLLNPQLFVDNGAVIQQDGSYYYETASTPNNLVLFSNTTQYSGQIAISAEFKYEGSTQTTGVIFRINYTDGTRDDIQDLSVDNTFHATTLVSSASKTVFSVTCKYNKTTTKTYIKDAQIELGSEATTYEAYHDGGTMTATEPLFGIGTVRDSEEGIEGQRTQNIATLILDGTENWQSSTSYFKENTDCFYIPYSAFGSAMKKAGQYNVVADKLITTYTNQMWSNADYECISGYDNNSSSFGLFVRVANSKTGALSTDTQAEASAKFKTWLASNNIVVYYELATPVQSSVNQSTITLQAGTNVLRQTDGGRTADFTLDYYGTDYSIATNATHKYVKVINGSAELVTDVSSIDVRGGRDNLINLTKMFGATLEPSTLADFYGLFPTWQGYKLPYNQGSLLNFKGTGLKSVGFNLIDFGGRTLGEPEKTDSSNTTVRGPFDETKFYIGFSRDNYYYPARITDYSVSTSGISVTSTSNANGVAFPFRVIPGMTYRQENTNTRFRMAFYTYNGTFISYDDTESSEAPANAYWGMVVFIPGANNVEMTWTNPCVHLQWTGTRNGDYELYWSYTRPLPTLTYFPDGMNGRGEVCDEMNNKQAIKRFAAVDLGTLEWTHDSDSFLWSSSSLGSTIKKGDSGTPANIISELYMTSASGSMTGSASSAGTIGVNNAPTLFCNTGSATETPTGWLVYELASPIVTNFGEEVNMTAQISDFGTEECLPTNGYVPVTAPFNGIVLYAADYARTITKLPENYISKESMEALLALLSNLHNGNITMTYNSSTGEYSFNFTAN